MIGAAISISPYWHSEFRHFLTVEVVSIFAHVNRLDIPKYLFLLVALMSTMDPFSALPWFALKDILSYLPDLETLHRIYHASPAVAGFLRTGQDDGRGFFTEIVEAVLDNRVDKSRFANEPLEDPGWQRDTKRDIRLLTYIWWRIYDSLSAINDSLPDENLLPRDCEGLSSWIGTNTIAVVPNPPPLPRSIPSTVLLRLLGFCTWSRQVRHEYFHDTIKHCMQLRPQKVADPKEASRKLMMGAISLQEDDPCAMDYRSALPRSGGTIIPVDIGPARVNEDQRLEYVLLRLVLFREIQRSIVDLGLFEASDNARDFLRDVSPLRFWTTRRWSAADIDGKVFESWLQERTQSKGEQPTTWYRLSSQAVATQWKSYSVCCAQSLPSLTFARRHNPLSCFGMARSALFRGPREILAEFGYLVFDKERLCALGLDPTEDPTEPRRNTYDSLIFTLATVMSDEQWMSILQAQKDNPRFFFGDYGEPETPPPEDPAVVRLRKERLENFLR